MVPVTPEAQMKKEKIKTRAEVNEIKTKIK